MPGQHDDLILRSNVIKHLIQVLKSDNGYWDIASKHDYQSEPEVERFLSMFTMSNAGEGVQSQTKEALSSSPRR